MLTIPFYSNTSDDTHCFQACLRMILKYFEPDREFSWEELDTISAKVEGKWTWPLASMVWLIQRGYTVKNFEIFVYERFITEKDAYLIEFCGEEVGNEQIRQSTVSQEIEYAKKIVERQITTCVCPTMETAFQLLTEGYLLICNVNSSMLNGESGYCGHVVLISDLNDSAVIMHDPGLPPVQNRSVPIQTFERAWAYPTESAKNILAIKK